MIIRSLALFVACTLTLAEGRAADGKVSSNSPVTARQANMLRTIRERGYLVVGNCFKFPSLNSKNKATGEYEGFFVDISRAMAKSILGDEKKVEFKYAGGVDNLGAVQFVVEGEVDVIVDAVAQSATKKAVSCISDAVMDSGSALLVREGNPIRSIDDLKKGTVVLFGVANTEREFLRAVMPDATYVPYLDSLDISDDFAAGKGDVVTEFYPHLYTFASRIPHAKIYGQFTDKPYGIISPKPDPAFAEFINKFLRDMKASGEYDRIYQKWFGRYLGTPDLGKPTHTDIMQRVVAAEAAIRAQRPPGGMVSLSALMYAANAEVEKVKAQLGASSPTLDRIRQRGKVVLGSAYALPQTNCRNATTSEQEGFMADVGKSLAKKVLGDERKLEWRFARDEQDALRAVAAGEVDCVVGTVDVGYHLENTQLAEFAVEIYRSGPALLVRKDSKIRVIDDITSSTRVIVPVTLAHDIRHIKTRTPNATFVEVANAAEGFAALRAGKGDLYTDAVPALYPLAVQDSNYTLAGRYAERPQYMVCRQNDPAMRAFLISFVAELVTSGERERFNRKWFIPYGGDIVR